MLKNPTCWYQIETTDDHIGILKLFNRNMQDYNIVIDGDASFENEIHKLSKIDTDIGQSMVVLEYKGQGNIFFLFEKESPFERYLLRKGALKKVEPFKARVLDIASGINTDHTHDAGIEPRPLADMEGIWYNIKDFSIWNKAFKEIWNRDFLVTHYQGHADFEKRGDGMVGAWYHFEEINGESGYAYVKLVPTRKDELLCYVQFTQDSPFKEKVIEALIEVSHEKELSFLNAVMKSRV